MRRPIALLLIAAAALALLFLASPATAADGNDWWTSATPISPGISGPYDLDPAYDIDWYSFNLSVAADLLIETNGSSGATSLTLYDASLYGIAYDDHSISPWSHLTHFALPGQYFAVVSDASGTNATFYNYSLKFAITPTYVLTEGVNGPFDSNSLTKVDWYVLNVTEPSTLVLQTGGPSGDSAVYLYNRYFNWIAYEEDTYTNWSRLTAFLPTALYYLSVASTSYNTSLFGYTIDVEFAPPIPLADGQNGPFNATYGLTPNWFSFDVAVDQWVRLVIPTSPVMLEIRVMDRNFYGLGSDNYGNGSVAARVVLDLGPGRYYVNVFTYYSYEQGSDYFLVLDRASSAGFDGNDLRAGATPINFGANGPFDLDPGFEDDWYVFTVAGEGVVEIWLMNSGWGHTAGLYDDGGVWLAETGSYYYSGASIQRVIPVGTYYVLVHDDQAGSTAIGYLLNLDFTPAPPPDHNGDRANATTALEGVAGPFTLYINDTDWYVFTTGVPGTIYAESWGPRGGADLVLFDNYLNQVASGYSVNGSFESVSATVDQGTFYIRASLPYNSLAVPVYNLTITFTPWVSADGNDFGSQARRMVAGPNGPYSLHPTSDNDWFYFDVEDTGETVIQVLANVDLTVVLYNSSWSTVTQSYYTSQPIDAALEAGRYFARVALTYTYNGEVDSYRLNLTLPDYRAPPLLLTGPSNGTSVTTGSIRVSGTTEPGAHVWVDGGEVVVNATGAFTKVIAIPVGENDIIILARDLAGNEAQVMVTVIGVDPNDQIVVQISHLSDELNATQQQLTTTQQQLTATQQQLTAAQTAASEQTATTDATGENLQSQLNAANASIEAARLEAGAQRSVAMMGMVLGLAAVALAAAVGLMSRRKTPGAAASVAPVFPSQELNARAPPSGPSPKGKAPETLPDEDSPSP